jgi:hypothetical protein
MDGVSWAEMQRVRVIDSAVVFSCINQGQKVGSNFLSPTFHASFIFQRPSTDQRTRRKRVP